AVPRARWIVLFALAVVVFVVGTFFVQSTIIYPSQVVVKEAGSAIGINPLEDRVDFGDVPQGAGVSKTIIFENEGTIANRMVIMVIGGIGDLVQTDPSSFTLKPGERMEVRMRLLMPESAEVDKVYSGNVVVLRLPLGIL
ncbi:MAG: hypothetical protein HY685_03150, partial [Chloroflexi bacterium]|nr:hypothetical protein [Chloroflexota bacterium]